MEWKFHEERNTACFTTSLVLKGSPILRVYHDYDGDWQFHGDSTQTANEGNDGGTIENDPHHDAACYGDALAFHSLHVAEVDTDE